MDAAAMPPGPDADQEFYRALIGPSNQAQYLAKFERFDRGGAAVSWNWGAFFFTFIWLLYRKQWRNALLYMVLPNIVLIAMLILAAATGSPGFLSLSVGAYWLAILLLPPLFADVLYHRLCRARMAAARASGQSRDWQLGLLTGTGGTSSWLAPVVVVYLFTVVIGICAAIAIPAYQNYHLRADTAAAAKFAGDVTGGVEAYRNSHDRMPDSFAALDYPQPVPEFVQSVTVSKGAIAVAYEGEDGETWRIEMIPATDDAGRVTWRCDARSVPEKHRPKDC